MATCSDAAEVISSARSAPGRRSLRMLAPPLLLLLALFCMASQVHAASDCSNVASLHATVQTQCQVTTVFDLHDSTLPGGASPQLCASGCKAAVLALLQDLERIDACADAALDTALGRTNARTAVADVYKLTAACQPPSATCLRLLRQTANWLASPEGSGCTALFDSIVQSGSDMSAQLSTLCSGRCRQGMDHYTAQLEASGCGAWAVTLRLRHDFASMCYAADGQFCAQTFHPSRNENALDAARNISLSRAARDAQLATVCGPCLAAFVRASAPYLPSPANILELEQLCVRDSELFCYPRYQDALAAVGASGIYDQSQAYCDVSMGNCATKMFARIVQNEDSSTATQTANRLHMKYMCLHGPGRQLCSTLASSVVSNVNGSGLLTAEPYDGPIKCDGLNTGDFCLWGCQRTFTTDRDAFGCCYTSQEAYFNALGLTDASTTFAQGNVIATECNRGFETACETAVETTETTFVLNLNVPCWFTLSADLYSCPDDRNCDPAGSLTAVQKDLMRLTGRLEESVYPRTVLDEGLYAFGCNATRTDSDGNALSTLTVTVKSEDNTEVGEIIAAVTADVGRDMLMTPFLDALYAKRARVLPDEDD